MRWRYYTVLSTDFFLDFQHLPVIIQYSTNLIFGYTYTPALDPKPAIATHTLVFEVYNAKELSTIYYPYYRFHLNIYIGTRYHIIRPLTRPNNHSWSSGGSLSLSFPLDHSGRYTFGGEKIASDTGRRRREKNLKTTGPIAIVEYARERVIVIYAYPGGPCGIWTGEQRDRTTRALLLSCKFIAIQKEEYLKKKIQSERDALSVVRLL